MLFVHFLKDHTYGGCGGTLQLCLKYLETFSSLVYEGPKAGLLYNMPAESVQQPAKTTKTHTFVSDNKSMKKIF